MSHEEATFSQKVGLTEFIKKRGLVYAYEIE
jgi:hypothetical protein